MRTQLVRTLRKNSPTILTVAGIAAMWVTAALLAKSAPVAKEKLEDAEEEKGEDLTVVEKVKTVAPVVWPALAVGAVGSYSLICANSIHLRRTAALTSAYLISRDALREYRAKVVEHIGERKEQKVRDDVAKERLNKNPASSDNIVITGHGDHLCYIVPFGLYFQSDINKVRQAVNTINERLVTGGELYITANDFLTELGIKPIGVGDDLGWDIENGSLEVSYSSALAADDRPCLTLDFELYPV